jgi:hypothetical protein
MEWLQERLKVNQFEDWYRISASSFVKNRGGALLALYKYLILINFLVLKLVGNALMVLAVHLRY